jgi:hypothetical protein
MSLELVDEPDLIRVRLFGVLIDQDLRDIVAAAMDLERTPPIPPRITDMTGVTDLQVAYPDILRLAEQRRALRFPNDFKSAIMVSGTAQMGMARMFQTLNDNPQITIGIFTDAAQALAWVRS